MMTQTVHGIFYKADPDQLHLDYHRYRGGKLLGATMTGHWRGNRGVAPDTSAYDRYVAWLIGMARDLIQTQEGALWQELGVADAQIGLVHIEWYKTANAYAKSGEIGIWIQFHRLGEDGRELHPDSYSNYLLEIKKTSPNTLRALVNEKEYIEDWQGPSQKMFEALQRAETITRALDRQAGWEIASKKGE